MIKFRLRKLPCFSLVKAYRQMIIASKSTRKPSVILWVISVSTLNSLSTFLYHSSRKSNLIAINKTSRSISNLIERNCIQIRRPGVGFDRGFDDYFKIASFVLWLSTSQFLIDSIWVSIIKTSEVGIPKPAQNHSKQNVFYLESQRC